MCSLRHPLMGILVLSFLFLAACDGTKTTKSDADQLPTDDIAVDGDLLTDDLIPDEEEPDDADIDTKTDTKPDGDKLDGDMPDTDTVDVEPDIDEPVTDDMVTDDVVTDDVVTDDVVVDDVVTDDILTDEDTVPVTRRTLCLNIPENAHGIGANADGKFEQTQNGAVWEPETFECAWECNKSYLPNEAGDACFFLATIYVNHAATDGANNGSSWENAFTDLSDAIEEALDNSQQEIWVAQGTYTPTFCFTSPQETCPFLPRKQTFTLKPGVGIYGGFVGDETARDERDWEANETILSGDLDGDDAWDDLNEEWLNRDENAYHVIQIIWDDRHQADAVLDGFTVTGGVAIDEDDEGIEDKGGGLLAGDNEDSADFTVRNCRFVANTTAGGGGAIAVLEMSPTIENCTFIDNSALVNGGAVMLAESPATVTGCRFENNFTTGTTGSSGGAIAALNNSALTVVESDFIGNRSVKVAAIDAGGPSLTINYGYFQGNEGAAGNEANGIVTMQAGGTIEVFDSTFEENAPVVIEVRDATLTVAGSFFTGNEGPSISTSGGLATITGTIFENNAAVNGGAIENSGSDMAIVRCRFVGNHADLPGSGFAGIGGAIFATMAGTMTVADTVFDGNSAALWGGAVALIMSSPIFLNCTFDGNSDSTGDRAIFMAQSDPTFDNTILWGLVGQHVGELGPFDFEESVPLFRYSDVKDSGGSTSDCGIGGDEYCWVLPFGTDGGGNIDEDPLFVGSGDDPLDLQATSPCVNTGNNDLVPDEEYALYDLLAADRIQSVTVDMGAYEQ